MYKRILVPLDGSSFSEAALPQALSLAIRWNAALELATVANPPVPGQERSAPDSITREGEVPPWRAPGRSERDQGRVKGYLSDVGQRLRAAGFQGEIHEAVIPAGNIAASLVRHLVDRNGDFIVMTTHGRGAVQRAWLGSSADGVIRRSPVPVLLIRPEDRVPESPDDEPVSPDLSTLPGPFERVLFPLDGSKVGEHLAAHLAAPLMSEAGADCLLLQAVPPLTAGATPYLPHLVFETGEHEAIVASSTAYLEGMAAQMPFGTPRTRVVVGMQPAVAILEAAEEEGVDLIAMSTHGRGAVGRLLLGSVADKVVRGAHVPVLVYRRPESAADED